MDRIGTIAERVASGSRVAAGNDLGDIKELLEEMHEKQEEVARKQEEYRQETNRLWNEATKDVQAGTLALLKDIHRELVTYFKGNGMGVRTSSVTQGLVEVFVGSDDVTSPDVGKRYQSKVSVLLHLTFEDRENEDATLRNENGDETVQVPLKDKGTVAALMQEVKKADKKGFWELVEDEEMGTISWRK